MAMVNPYLFSCNPLGHARPVKVLLNLTLTSWNPLGTFTLTSWNPLGHAGPVQGCYTFTLNSWNHLGHASSVMGHLNHYLNILEPSGPRQVCNGTAIPLAKLPGKLWPMPGL